MFQECKADLTLKTTATTTKKTPAIFGLECRHVDSGSFSIIFSTLNTKENSVIFNSMDQIGGLMLSEISQIIKKYIRTHWKRPWYWERLKAGGEGMTEDKMVGWHHWFNGNEFEQAPGVGDGQGSLVGCSPCGHRELDMTEQLHWTELYDLTSMWNLKNVNSWS